MYVVYSSYVATRVVVESSTVGILLPSEARQAPPARAATHVISYYLLVARSRSLAAVIAGAPTIICTY
jgi:hypothetical protein